MQVSFVDPHHPFDPPAEVAKNYPPDDIPLPKYRDCGDVVWPPSLAKAIPDYSSVTDDMTRTTIAHYYAMMETLDRAVGHLVNTIEQAGELDNTLFVFVADHGELLGDYGMWRKGSFHYDCIMRVPSFITYAGHIEADQRLRGLTQCIDLAPTLLGFAGIEVPDYMQGRDLSEPLANKGDVDRGWVYTELFQAYWGPFVHCWTVRTHKAKYTYFGHDRDGHLFDLASDPDERRNVFDDPNYRALRDEMVELLQHELALQQDPLPRLLTQF
jgi:arylsulfatase A-like enzyme